MKNTNGILSQNEMQLMEVFWSINKPVTSVDLAPYFNEWKNGYLHNLLKGLQIKGLLDTKDIIQYGRRYAKQYVAAVTKEQYIAKIVSTMNVSKKNLSKVAVALVEEVSAEDETYVIEELESILDILKQRTKK